MIEPLRRFAKRGAKAKSVTGEAAQRREAGAFCLVHADPGVLFAPDWEIADPRSPLWSIFEAIPERRTYLVVQSSWTLLEGNPRDRANIIHQVSQRFHHVVVLTSCPTVEEAAALQREGVSTLHCSTSALVREDFFTPSPGRQPRFDAIYDARWASYKRHDLAGAIRSLALIAQRPQEPKQVSIDYVHGAHAAVKHATWILSPWGPGNRWLSHEEINAAYNQARVGLCLSRAEGQMLASVQYLLAGLPVVTTRNLGGRDEFFDPAYVCWVEDDPTAVAAAVDELVSLNLDPQMIREATLAKISQHRARMQTWMRQAIEAEGGELGRWDGDWPVGLPNYFWNHAARAADVVAEINQGPRA